MKELKYTLIADGSSDRVILNIIKWLLDDLYPELPNDGYWADFRQLKSPPEEGDIAQKVLLAEKYYPFDILFIHRDCEDRDKQKHLERLEEISHKLPEGYNNKTVRIVPIKMMETWLMIDEYAIKQAAGNRNSQLNNFLPPPKQLENENEPKKTLHQLLKDCSGLKGKNLTKFNPHKAVHDLAEYIEDYSKLRHLSAFKAFELELQEVMSKLLSES